jgi:hypothetical protein
MRQLLVYFLLIATCFTACKKDDKHLFDKSADQRLNEALTAYQAQLTGAPYGWKSTLYTKGGGIYTFYFKFNNSNRVQMLSSFDFTSATALKESSYRLKALQQPSLVFDTYSYLHVLADPNPNINGGSVGAGLQSDFEFYFDSTSADTIHLVGRFNGSKATLVRATQAEANAFSAGQLAGGLQLNKVVTYFERLTIGSNSYDFHFDPSSQTIQFQDDNGNLLDSTRNSAFYLTLGGLTLQKPITIGNQTISDIADIQVSSATQTISCTVNNVAATITAVTVPRKVDVSAARRWWTTAATNGTYWYSFNGFHVNGVDDAFNITSIKSGSFPYYYLIYFPAFRTNNDLFGPVFVDLTANSLTLDYATAPRFPTYTTDGRAVFTPAGDYGTFPTGGPATASRAVLYSSNGFYFVQTSETTYDMVGAADGKTWISWTYAG